MFHFENLKKKQPHSNYLTRTLTSLTLAYRFLIEYFDFVILSNLEKILIDN